MSINIFQSNQDHYIFYSKNLKDKKSNTFVFLGLLMFMFFAAGYLFIFSDAKAQSGGNELLGVAYSSDIGWISFNCLNDNSCGSVDYKVTVQESGGNLNLVGEAWSDQVGWIKFGGLSDFPDASGTEPVNARFNSAVDGLEGWARVCLGTINEDCSDMEDHPSGFDGWISLSGDIDGDGSYGVTYENGEFHDNAWGGAALNWISFSGDVAGNGGSYGVTLSGFEYEINHDHQSAGTALVANPNSERTAEIELNLLLGQTQNVKLSHSAPEGINVSFNPSECSPDCSSTMEISVEEEVEDGTYTITIEGTDEDDIITTSEFYLEVVDSAASVNLSASPTIVEVEGHTLIEWDVSGAESCETSGDWRPWEDNNPVVLENGNSNASQSYGPFNDLGSYEFTLECLDIEEKPTQDSVTVSVLATEEFHTVECEADGEFFVGHEVTWRAEATPKGDGEVPGEGYQYEWSGDFGSEGNPGNSSEFSTVYSTIGTKNVEVVVTNPTNGVAVLEDCQEIRINVDPGFIIF